MDSNQVSDGIILNSSGLDINHNEAQEKDLATTDIDETQNGDVKSTISQNGDVKSCVSQVTVQSEIEAIVPGSKNDPYKTYRWLKQICLVLVWICIVSIKKIK